MSKKVLIEGMLLATVGLVSMVEGLRITRLPKDVHIQDEVGPGFYLFFLSLLLFGVGIAHIIVHYRNTAAVEKRVTDKKMRVRMMSMVGILVVYIFIIDLVGYLLASFTFFLLEFRVVGIKSWPMIIVLSLVLTAIYYFLFVRLCDMTFPPAIWFSS